MLSSTPYPIFASREAISFDPFIHPWLGVDTGIGVPIINPGMSRVSRTPSG